MIEIIVSVIIILLLKPSLFLLSLSFSSSKIFLTTLSASMDLVNSFFQYCSESSRLRPTAFKNKPGSDDDDVYKSFMVGG